MSLPGAELLAAGWFSWRLSLSTGELPVDPAGVVERTAVRAVVRRGSDLLMVHSPVAGDYKFPGGGLEPGETMVDALVREVREECGRGVTGIGGVLLVVDERRPGDDPGWVLKMTSVYVGCSVGPVEHDLALDEYERRLGFQGAWVRAEEALRANEASVAGGTGQPWTARESAVLTWLGSASACLTG